MNFNPLDNILRPLNVFKKSPPSNAESKTETVFYPIKTGIKNDNILHPIPNDNLNHMNIDKGNSISAFNFISPDMKIFEEGVTEATKNTLNSIPGICWAGKLPSNGNREVAIVIPQGTDVTKPVEVMYYFHGLHGKISKSLDNPDTGFKSELVNMAKEGRNVVFIMPQGPAAEANAKWMNPKFGENMQKLQDETTQIINQRLNPNIKTGSITVKGHSGGGEPIKNAADSNTLKADKIHFFDASYGDWASRTYNKMVTTNPDIDMKVFYLKNTGTEADSLRLKNKKGVELIGTTPGPTAYHGLMPKKFFQY